MSGELDDEKLLASAKTLGIRLFRNEDGLLLAPLPVFAHALNTTEEDVLNRLAARGTRFVTVDTKVHEIN